MIDDREKDELAKAELRKDSSARAFYDLVEKKSARKLRAKKIDSSGIWFGLGMMGLVGWSVAIPTLLGATLGVWLDKHYPDEHTYTLALLIAGLCLGCLNAWHWVGKEQREMHDQQKEKKDE